MEENDKKKFASWLAALSESCPASQVLTPAKITLYWECLKDLEFEDLARAGIQYLKLCDKAQFFPMPYDIRKYIDGGVEHRALTAWSLVVETMKRYGRYTTLMFADNIISHVIKDMGGWDTVCNFTEDELPFREKDFNQRYKLYFEQGRKLKPIKFGSLSKDEPVLIGVEFKSKNKLAKL